MWTYQVLTLTMRSRLLYLAGSIIIWFIWQPTHKVCLNLNWKWWMNLHISSLPESPVHKQHLPYSSIYTHANQWLCLCGQFGVWCLAQGQGSTGCHHWSGIESPNLWLEEDYFVMAASFSSRLTSSMTLAQVRESPHIADPNAEAHTG